MDHSGAGKALAANVVDVGHCRLAVLHIRLIMLLDSRIHGLLSTVHGTRGQTREHSLLLLLLMQWYYVVHNTFIRQSSVDSPGEY